MQRFYHLSTSDFQPISFGNIYLYGEYTKIKNFLVSKKQENLLKALAIPSYKKNHIEWSANSSGNIKKLDQFNQEKQQEILHKYNEFLKVYNIFTKQLKNSKQQDNQNWGELLSSLIEGSANELFFDGETIFITWGWKLLDENSKKLIPVYHPNKKGNTETTKKKPEETQEPEPIPIIDPVKKETKHKKIKKNWIDKLYLFLKKLWWLIPLLSTIILILLLLQTCEKNRCKKNCEDLENNLNNIDLFLKDCECKLTDCEECEENKKEIVKDAVPCNTATKSGGDGITRTKHNLGKKSGNIEIEYDMYTEPDKLEVFYEGKRVCSTFEIRNNKNGFVGDGNSAGCCGILKFKYKAKKEQYCTVIITGGNDTDWKYTLSCPK